MSEKQLSELNLKRGDIVELVRDAEGEPVRHTIKRVITGVTPTRVTGTDLGNPVPLSMVSYWRVVDTINDDDDVTPVVGRNPMSFTDDELVQRHHEIAMQMQERGITYHAHPVEGHRGRYTKQVEIFA